MKGLQNKQITFTLDHLDVLASCYSITCTIVGHAQLRYTISYCQIVILYEKICITTHHVLIFSCNWGQKVMFVIKMRPLSSKP